MERKTSVRRVKTANQTLYSYVEPVNSTYARTYGKRNFGSFSRYINTLIMADRKLHFSRKFIEKQAA